MHKASNMYDNDMGVHMLQCVVYKPALHCIVSVFNIIQDWEKGWVTRGKITCFIGGRGWPQETGCGLLDEGIPSVVNFYPIDTRRVVGGWMRTTLRRIASEGHQVWFPADEVNPDWLQGYLNLNLNSSWRSEPWLTARLFEFEFEFEFEFQLTKWTLIDFKAIWIWIWIPADKVNPD